VRLYMLKSDLTWLRNNNGNVILQVREVGTAIIIFFFLDNTLLDLHNSS